MSREAMKHALEALRTLHDENMDYLTRNNLGGENNQCMVFARETITALSERLAQPEQEPVAHTLNCVCGAVWDVSPDGVEEMVHAPNPTQRKPLTEKRIEELYSFWVVDCQDIVGFARAVERTVKGEV